MTAARRRTRPSNIFRREGEYWTVGYEGTVLRLRDSKGIGSLAYLLGRPGEPIPAAVLLLGSDGSSGRTAANTAANAEQARVAVTKRLRTVVKRIREHHPSLGHHLAGCIKTGRFCSYIPNPEHPTSWVLR